MSERKRRYFQHESGGVYYATMPDTVADYENDRTMTEVQVVPVDAIIIRRDELPEVYPNSEGPGYEAKHPDADSTWVDPSILGAEFMRGRGLECIALAEYLREHPPVDTAQVSAVLSALLGADDIDIAGDEAYKVARFMVERFGVRVGGKS